MYPSREEIVTSVLGLDKPHEILPPHYAWWLQKREETLKVSAMADRDQSA